MNTQFLRTHVSKALLLSLLLSTNASYAGKMIAQVGPSAPPTPSPKMAAPMPGKQLQTNKPADTKRVADWFAQYDQIRRNAQMSPSEKANAHKMLQAVFSGDNNDKAAARSILTKMIARYDVATKSLASLKRLPETASLQEGYLHYFKTGRAFFGQFLSSLNKKIDQNTIANLQNNRRGLAMLDMSNKMLDKNLRKKFNIPAYKYD